MNLVAETATNREAEVGDDNMREITRSLLDVEWYVYGLARLAERFPGTLIDETARELLADLGYTPEDREEVETTIRAAGYLLELDLIGDGDDGVIAFSRVLREQMERDSEFAEQMRPVIRETMTLERLRQMLELLDADIEDN